MEINQKKALLVLKFLYPLWAIVGFCSIMYIPSVLIVADDAVKTASNIQANELFFRTGIVGSLLTQLLFIFAGLFLYKLFEKVNRTYAAIMIILVLVSVPIAMLNEINNIAALLSLGNPNQMKLFLDLHAQGEAIASIFWGLWLFPLGLLVKNSGYFPKIIGWLVVAAGFGYTISSFLIILTPNVTSIISLLEVLTIGEIIFMLWLVFKGAYLPK